jgi:hypothetical protein
MNQERQGAICYACLLSEKHRDVLSTVLIQKGQAT